MNILLHGQQNQQPIITDQMLKRSMAQRMIEIPPIFYWEFEGMMTAAFKWKGMNFGESWALTDNKVKNDLNKNKLVALMKGTLDVLVHHGKRVLDDHGNIDIKAVNDCEAERFWMDADWKRSVEALNASMMVKDITKDQAKKLD